jgi:fibrillarin-like pre-rRNA processing protein
VESTRWPSVYRDGRDLYTVNGEPGTKLHGEALKVVGGVEYRLWDPFRSKLAAFLAQGAPEGLLEPPRKAVYLGGAHGTTTSYLADVWPNSEIFVVEKSPTAFVPLLALARRRTNLLPILADARLPERYRAEVGEAEFLYQDIAQRDQAEIFCENAAACLARRGRGVLMLKIRSVTQRRPVPVVIREARRVLESGGFRIDAEVPLAPFSRDHAALAVSRRE